MAVEHAVQLAMTKAGIEELKEKQRTCILKLMKGNDVFDSLSYFRCIWTIRSTKNILILSSVSFPRSL